MNILEICNLQKNYGEYKVLKDLSFSVKENEILGFLGPNGAGKSTTINILSTVLSSTEGNITFFGRNIIDYKREYKRNIGIVPQNLAIFQNMSAIDNVRFFAGFYGLKKKELDERANVVLEMVGLKERANDLPKTFSGGMKRRLNIACALTHEPKLLILDEPTVGIDPQSRNHILEVIKKLQEQGTTIIYTTHYMEEVEAICDRVVILDEGRKLAEGSISELISSDIEIYNINGNGIEDFEIDTLHSIKGVKEVVKGTGIKVISYKSQNIMNQLIQMLLSNGVQISSIAKEEKNLEKIFLELTGKNLRD